MVPETTEAELAKRVGGRLCLDFVNTVGGRVSASGGSRTRDYADRVVGEWLVSYDALVRWGALAGALTARDAQALTREAVARPAQAARALTRTIALREAMYRVFKAVIEEWPPEQEDLAALNRELHAARARERLVTLSRERHVAGTRERFAAAPQFAWTWEAAPAALDRAVWPVVGSAAELLTAPDLARVRQCPGEACGWLFLDTSRSGRRQWCDMADCGNLAKVRRFRARHRGPR